MKNLFTNLWVKVGLVLMALPPALAQASSDSEGLTGDQWAAAGESLATISAQSGFQEGAQAAVNLSARI